MQDAFFKMTTNHDFCFHFLPKMTDEILIHFFEKASRFLVLWHIFMEYLSKNVKVETNW